MGSPAAVAAEGGHIDGRRARGDSTRRAILRHSMQIASVEGLEGLSLARLAADLEMSKSGLFAHFGSKEELQLSTLRAARRVFADYAVTPAAEEPEGLARLLALTDAWLDYIGADTFPGGCLFIQAAAEYDGRPGPVRDLVAETMAQWLGLLVEQIRLAVDHGELSADSDPEQLAWDLHAFGLALNWDRQLNRNASALERSRRATRARLHVAATAKGRRRLAA
jgi:AcrR family transcriptional regulator